MSNKMALLLFTTSVLLTSFAAMSIPQASALNNNGVDNSHVTARFEGDMKVCGSHLCTHGEKTAWDLSVWGSQNIGHGKVGTTLHGEDVMKKMSGATPNSTTAHGTPKHMTAMQMTTNGTNSTNMTGTTPSGTK